MSARQTDAAIRKMSQADRILEYLQSDDGTVITAKTAMELLGCYRLAARIADLRARGYQILTTYHTSESGARYAVYSLQEDNA